MSQMVDDLVEKFEAKILTPPEKVAVNGIEQIQLPAEKPWPSLGDDAFCGLAGKIVRHLEPRTEADQNGLLLGLLAAYGNACGPGPHFPIGATLHRANLFVCLVGQSAKARKGTCGDILAAIFRQADADWADNHLVSGLSTGEGLGWLGRDAENDPPEAPRPKLAKGDKRLFVEEAEFGLSLQCGSRTGNTLSSSLRKLWDFKNLEFLSKNSGFRATGIFASIVAHITLPELETLISASDVANGFSNRFLWCCVRRSKKLPFGGDTGGLEDYAKNIGWRLAESRRIERMSFTPAGAKVWESAYHGELSTEYPGKVGDVLSRAEAQALRLSMVFALLDETPEISDDHVRAGLAVWRYCLESAVYIFGDHHGSLGDKIRILLLEAGVAGLTRTQIHDGLGRNYTAREIVSALAAMRQAGQAAVEAIQRPGPGRPLETWRAIPELVR